MAGSAIVVGQNYSESSVIPVAFLYMSRDANSEYQMGVTIAVTPSHLAHHVTKVPLLVF